jgi:hypothetical protein
MTKPYYISPPALDGTYDQWSLIQENDGEYVRKEHVTPRVHLSGAPHVRIMGSWPIGDFLGGDHTPLAKTRLQNLLDDR